MKADMIIKNAEELLTLQGGNSPRIGKEMNELGIINRGAIAIKDGKIAACGTTEQIENEFSAQTIIDATGKVVMPGFVDPHTHPVFCETREKEFEMRLLGKSYVEIAKAGGGILNSIDKVREADEKTLRDYAEKRIKRMLECGTTTLEAKSGYGLTTESELKMLRVIKSLQETMPLDIVPTFMGAHEFPREYKNNHEGYIELLTEEMLPRVKAENLAEFCDIFTEAHVYSLDESRRVLQRAKKLGFKLKMHADEIEAFRGAELAAELNAVSADHLGAASLYGIKALAAKKVVAVLLPATLFSLNSSTYAPARTMIENGVCVALATDYNPGSCNCDSMQFVISLACLKMKMTIAEAICASTINAACAINREEQAGSLMPQKNADIIILDIPSYQYIPYHLGSNSVETVLKRGKIVWER